MPGQLPQVVIYTDGACLGNPGPGGYGVVLLHGDGRGDRRKELSGGYRRTTNNRMELLAAIVGLQALNAPCAVTLHTDSRYLVDAVTKGWAKRWRANDWMRNKREPALNPDLWTQLLDLCAAPRGHEVRFVWVRGHAGDPENERCDELAQQAARGRNLPADEGYERSACPGVSQKHLPESSELSGRLDERFL
ncbi:MAG: ribonuclease HI [Chloroflexi bacterium]|nr:ribonuclease HI [Chloroflexota bacterium]MBU1748107.1 ribonuclease HI [Chloroflexota bacterium]MBU1880066.1 ribonuclease HI [Chloroflexota bacterium]